MIYASIERPFFYPNTAGRVRLRIHVYQQRRNVSGRKTCGEIDSCSGLSNPAFLIRYRDDFSHMPIRDAMKVNDAAQVITSEMPSKSVRICSTWNRVKKMEGRRGGGKEGHGKGVFQA